MGTSALRRTLGLFLIVAIGAAGCGSEKDEDALPTPQEWVGGLSASEVAEVCESIFAVSGYAPRVTRSNLRDSHPGVDEAAIEDRANEILTYMRDESCSGSTTPAESPSTPSVAGGEFQWGDTDEGQRIAEAIQPFVTCTFGGVGDEATNIHCERRNPGPGETDESALNVAHSGATFDDLVEEIKVDNPCWPPSIGGVLGEIDGQYWIMVRLSPTEVAALKDEFNGTELGEFLPRC